MPNPPFPSESNRLAAIADAARRLPAPEPAADSLDAVLRDLRTDDGPKQAAWVRHDTDHDDRAAFVAGWDAALAAIAAFRERAR